MAYEAVKRDVREFGHRVDGESRGNTCGAADEDGEELVEVVVLGDNHGEHHHFDGAVLIFEVNVANRTVHKM